MSDSEVTGATIAVLVFLAFVVPVIHAIQSRINLVIITVMMLVLCSAVLILMPGRSLFTVIPAAIVWLAAYLAGVIAHATREAANVKKESDAKTHLILNDLLHEQKRMTGRGV